VPLVDYTGRLLALVGVQRPAEKLVGGFWREVVPSMPIHIARLDTQSSTKKLNA
jgi:hypothetical protein